MTKKITATEAVRNFSEILNSVTYRGTSYTVVRGGKPVAEIHPSGKVDQERKLGELPDILKKIPRLGKEAVSFERDVVWAMNHQPSLSSGNEWE